MFCAGFGKLMVLSEQLAAVVGENKVSETWSSVNMKVHGITTSTMAHLSLDKNTNMEKVEEHKMC